MLILLLLPELLLLLLLQVMWRRLARLLSLSPDQGAGEGEGLRGKGRRGFCFTPADGKWGNEETGDDSVRKKTGRACGPREFL